METPSNPNPPAQKEPVCSICIANYNGIGIIDDCINSVLAQDTDISYELIIHDDASTDDSVSHIRTRYPDIRLIASQENVGFCVSNNRMVAVARGQYILLLNNDAALFPDALRTLHDYAIKQSAPAILGLPQYDAETGELLDMGALSDPFLNSVPNLNPAQADVAMIVGACLWIPKNLWEDIGGFPEWFHTLAEDMYLCCVARLWNCPVRSIARSGFRHWVGKSIGGGKVTVHRQLSTSRHRRALTERNKTFVMFLCYPTMLLWLVLPIHLSLILIEGILLALIKRDPGLWKTIYRPLVPALWHSRKKLFALRRKIQGARQTGVGTFFAVFQLIPYKLKMLIQYGVPHIR